TGKQYPFQLLHMFRTAADNFKVIEDKTKTVLVPYGEGEQIIADLLGGKTLSEKYRCLNKLQQYAVNIFEYQYRALDEKGAFVKSPIDGILILKDGFYHENLGIVEENIMDLLIK
ncbi:MAG: CRISPR-associated helicase/endonuclease Cas3, partial [Hungateiclostridium thermocellum]|nr:CRISPR-associated helicase/endonuclease Cas3 [Acetivibrio thermocellus]